MDDGTLQRTMLFDFFGDLLTEKQREYFDLYYNEDLTLSEIAANNGVSRQGVYDIIARAEKTLVKIEQKTGVIKRWRETYKELERAESMARELLLLSGGGGEAAELAGGLVLALEELNKNGI